MKEDLITLTRPDDFHLHIRNFPEAKNYLLDSAKWFSRALIMPNTLPPIDSVEKLKIYRSQIEQTGTSLTPLLSFKIMPSMDAQTITDLAQAGAVAGKLYPKGATTNAEDGVDQIEAIFPLFEAMQKAGLVLCIHGEDPNAPVLDRERAFFPVATKIINRFPNLRIVIEHLSSKEGVDFVRSCPSNVAATLTAHHLWFTLDDMMGNGFSPHLYCKPVIQKEEDRVALREAAFSGSPQFFFGSDSAPHLKEKKENPLAAAGVYSAPVAVPVLVQLFEEHGFLNRLEFFLSKAGAQFYQLPPNSETITLERKRWTVWQERYGVVLMLAGKELQWQLKE